ncbi:hypothetical protein S83_061668 [Arachis hypogaea]
MTESSARIFTQEKDLIQRSTKKVKTREEVDLNHPSNMIISSDLREDMTDGNMKVSYKESLLTPIGPRLEESPSVMEEVLENASDLEDRWYKEDKWNRTDEQPFDLCPVIPVSKEEFEDWCRPWKSALVVKVLGKRVGLAFMEQRLQRDWVRKGKIDVIDMDCDYFLVHFSDEEDYSHALMEGPWMVAGHSHSSKVEAFLSHVRASS